MSRCSIVIATYNRKSTLASTLERLVSLPDADEIIVVDNGSSDETAAAVRRMFPTVRLIRVEENRGAAARTVGVEATAAPYVAFCDDDCWWEPGSLERATELLDAHRRVAVINASVLVHDEDRLDEACRLMEASPVRKRSSCPGMAVGAFMAGASVVRRDAYLACGGYHARYYIGAEESLLALDLMDAGWELVYCSELVLHHHPDAAGRKPDERRRLVMRNRLWTSWLRRSRESAFRATLALARDARTDRIARLALLDAACGLPWVLRERRPIRPEVERQLERLVQLPA